MRKTNARTDMGGLPATILFRCPKGMSETDFKRDINRSFTNVFNVPIGQRIMNTEYLADSDSIMCYFRVGEAPPGHGFMLLPPDHPQWRGGSTEPFIGTSPLFAVGLGNTMSYTRVDHTKLDEVDIDNERFEYAARVNERLRGIKKIEWDEFQKVTRSVLIAHLIEGTQNYVAVTLVPQHEDCVWVPMLNDVLRMDSSEKSDVTFP